MAGAFAGLAFECKPLNDLSLTRRFDSFVHMNAHVSPPPDLKPHKLTVRELLAFERSGAFDGLPRMELLDGVLYEVSPQTSRHVVAKNELGFRLRLAVMEMDLPFAVLTEATLRTDNESAPEPDIAILTQLRVEDFYPANLVKLAVEIAVTTVSTDMGFKKALYASANIPEYWVVEVDAGRIHQFWSPEWEGYLQSRIVAFGETLDSVTLPGLMVGSDGLV